MFLCNYQVRPTVSTNLFFVRHQPYLKTVIVRVCKLNNYIILTLLIITNNYAITTKEKRQNRARHSQVRWVVWLSRPRPGWWRLSRCTPTLVLKAWGKALGGWAAKFMSSRCTVKPKESSGTFLTIWKKIFPRPTKTLPTFHRHNPEREGCIAGRAGVDREKSLAFQGAGREAVCFLGSSPAWLSDGWNSGNTFKARHFDYTVVGPLAAMWNG